MLFIFPKKMLINCVCVYMRLLLLVLCVAVVGYEIEGFQNAIVKRFSMLKSDYESRFFLSFLDVFFLCKIEN